MTAAYLPGKERAGFPPQPVKSRSGVFCLKSLSLLFPRCMHLERAGSAQVSGSRWLYGALPHHAVGLRPSGEGNIASTANMQALKRAGAFSLEDIVAMKDACFALLAGVRAVGDMASSPVGKQDSFNNEYIESIGNVYGDIIYYYYLEILR